MKLKVEIFLAPLVAAGLWFLPDALDARSNSGGAKEWYVKTTVDVADPVTGESWHDRHSGVFGKLDASEQGYDQHDIPAYASTVGSTAAITFVKGDDWGNRAGEYVTDYRSTKQRNDAWAFTVFSIVEGGEVTLSWKGLFELTPYQDVHLTRYRESLNPENSLLTKLNLIDLATGQVIPALDFDGNLNSYTFYLDLGESSRQFTWVLGPIKDSYFENDSLAVKQIKKNQREFETLQRAGRTRPHGPPEGNPFHDQ